MSEVQTKRFSVDTMAASGALKVMFGFEQYLSKTKLERSLLHLIFTRASQINGCAYCIDMHTKDARAEGESEQRLYGLSAWRETPYYSERERAVLQWTEAVTLIADTHAPDEAYEQLRQQFSEEECITLTMAIVSINSWNRLVISARSVPGTYQPAQKAAAH